MADEPKESMTPEEIEALRAEVRQIIDNEGVNQRVISEETGIAYGTLTPWVGGTYRGDNARIAGAVRRWLETRKERSRTRATLPTAPEFVPTQSALKFLDVLAYAQAAPDFAVIVGGAGIGKTTTIEHYKARNSNVFVVTAEPVLSSPNNMLSAIADAVGINEGRQVYFSRAITAKLKSAAALIVIDEAQHLSSQALDQLRAIHDKAGVGIVVVGNESVYSRLQGTERDARFAQLFSRVGMRITQPKSRARDICALIEAWRITDEKVKALLKVIAAKPGALRLMTKVIRLATMIAAGDDAPAITEAHVRRAWTQLSSMPLDGEAAA